jgi:hypothetical protein
MRPLVDPNWPSTPVTVGCMTGWSICPGLCVQLMDGNRLCEETYLTPNVIRVLSRRSSGLLGFCQTFYQTPVCHKSVVRCDNLLLSVRGERYELCLLTRVQMRVVARRSCHQEPTVDSVSAESHSAKVVSCAPQHLCLTVREEGIHPAVSS